MKKTIIYILSVIMILTTFSGCNGTSEDPDKESETKEEAATEKENPITDFLYSTLDDGTLIISYIGKDSNVVFPSEINGVKVTSISGISGEGIYTVESVTIPETVTTIVSEAFKDCTSLSEVNLPDSLVKIDREAFAGCTSLKHIYLPPNCFSDYIDGTDYSGYNIFGNSGLETVELSEGIEILPDNIFYMTNIKEITMPSTLKTIGFGALMSCEKLEKVTLNEGLKTIDSCAFGGCPKLTEIIIPSTVDKLLEVAFRRSRNLKMVKFEGNAPTEFYIKSLHDDFKDELPQFTVYYHEGAEGFTSPEWNGYKTEIW